jgi:hypothetical protein
VASSCECGNEPSGSITCGGISGLAEDLLASQEGLCSMELVSKRAPLPCRETFCKLTVLLSPSIQSEIQVMLINDDTDINVSVNIKGVRSWPQRQLSSNPEQGVDVCERHHCSLQTHPSTKLYHLIPDALSCRQHTVYESWKGIKTLRRLKLS